MNINPVTHGINPLNTQNNNKNHQNSVQNFKGNLVMKSSGNLLPDYSCKCLNITPNIFDFSKKVSKYLENFEIIERLRQTADKFISNFHPVENNENISPEDRDNISRFNLSKWILNDLPNKPNLKDSKKDTLFMQNRFVEIDDYRYDPKFVETVDKCLCAKGTQEERASQITNLLLEYMGYEKDTIKPKIVNARDNYSGIYSLIDNKIFIDKSLMSNSILCNTLMHELTHMDNFAKIIKYIGIDKYLAIEFGRIKPEINPEKHIHKRKKLIKNIRKYYPELNINATDEEIYPAWCSMIKNKYFKNFFNNASISNDKYTGILTVEFLNNTYTSHSIKNSILSFALNNFRYYNSPNEILAFARGNEVNSLLSEKRIPDKTDDEVAVSTAHRLAKDNAEELFGSISLEKLGKRRIRKLGKCLNDNYIKYKKFIAQFLENDERKEALSVKEYLKFMSYDELAKRLQNWNGEDLEIPTVKPEENIEQVSLNNAQNDIFTPFSQDEYAFGGGIF